MTNFSFKGFNFQKKPEEPLSKYFGEQFQGKILIQFKFPSNITVSIENLKRKPNARPFWSSMAERQRFGCIDTCNCKQVPSFRSPIVVRPNRGFVLKIVIRYWQELFLRIKIKILPAYYLWIFVWPAFSHFQLGFSWFGFDSCRAEVATWCQSGMACYGLRHGLGGRRLWPPWGSNSQ